MNEFPLGAWPDGSVSLLAYVLVGFPTRCRGGLMLSAASNRPTPARSYSTCVEDFRDEFDMYWQDMLGFPAPFSELQLCLDLYVTADTFNHFCRLNHSETQEDIEAALQHILIHLQDRVLQLRRFRMN